MTQPNGESTSVPGPFIALMGKWTNVVYSRPIPKSGSS